MKAINLLTLNYLKRNKKKSFAIILGIILGTTLIFSMSLAFCTIRKYKIEYAYKYYGKNHAIYKNLQQNDYEKLKNNPQIQEVITLYELKQIKENNYIIYIKALENNIDEYFSIVKGTYPSNQNEIIIPQELAQIKKLDINDKIDDYEIVGIYDIDRVGLEPRYEHLHSNGFSYAEYSIITKSKPKEINKVDYITKYKSIINIYNKIYKTADELNLKYSVSNERIYENVKINDALLNAMYQYSNNKNQFGIYLMFIALLTIISTFCALTIRNAFLISLSERKQYFGVLRSIGTSKKQIIQMIFLEIIILSLIAIPIGIILSFSMTSIIINLVNKILKEIIESPYKISFYLPFNIISLIFIVATIIISGLKPAKEASMVSPIKLVKENNILKTQENYPKIKKYFGYEGELAYKNIKRNNSKFKVTTESLTISMILFIVLATFCKIGILQMEDYTTESDITINLLESKNQKEILETIENMPYIDKINVTKISYLNTRMNEESLTKEALNKYQDRLNNMTIKIIGLDDSSYAKYAKKLGIKNETILYNIQTITKEEKEYKIAKYNNLEELSLCNEKECYYTFKNIKLVNKTYDKTMYETAIILPLSEYETIYKNYILKNQQMSMGNDYYINIDSKNFMQLDSKIQDIRDENEETLYYTNNAINEYKERKQLFAYKLVLYSFVTFTIIISLTNIINTLNTNLSLRETEFAILRSIGLSKKGLNKMLKLEILFLCLKTIYSGTIISTIFVIAQILFSKLITNSEKILPFPVDIYIYALLGLILIIELISLYAQNKIKNKNIIDSIRKKAI